MLYYQRGAEGENAPETIIGRGPTTEPLVVEVILMPFIFQAFCLHPLCWLLSCLILIYALIHLLSWSAKSPTRASSMNITFQMDVPGRATTGAMDHGLLAAKNVDQVRLKAQLRFNLLILFPGWIAVSIFSLHQAINPAWSSARLTTKPIRTISALLCQGHSQTEHATPTHAHKPKG